MTGYITVLFQVVQCSLFLVFTTSVYSFSASLGCLVVEEKGDYSSQDVASFLVCVETLDIIGLDCVV